MIEPVAELLAPGFLAFEYTAHQPAPRPHPLAQRIEHVGAFGEAFGEDVARIAVRRSSNSRR
jgi:hypothetical protein